MLPPYVVRTLLCQQMCVLFVVVRFYTLERGTDETIDHTFPINQLPLQLALFSKERKNCMVRRRAALV